MQGDPNFQASKGRSFGSQFSRQASLQCDMFRRHSTLRRIQLAPYTLREKAGGGSGRASVQHKSEHEFASSRPVAREVELKGRISDAHVSQPHQVDSGTVDGQCNRNDLDS